MATTKLDDLFLFVALVESGSFTLAAKKLNIPKSKLSRHLVELEKNIGSQLLIRTTRKQHLTESGHLLYRSCKPHIDALTQVEEEIGSMVNEPKGKLNILLPLEFFNRIISVLITDFAKLYPGICLHCHHYSGTMPEFDYQYDLTFVLHEGQLPESDWVAKTLLNFPQSIYAGESANIAHLKEPEDLQNEMAILSGANQQWLFRDQQNIQIVPMRGRIVLSSPEMRLEATRQNLGIAKLPDYVCQSNDGEFNNINCGLKRLNLTKAPMAQQLSVLYHSRSIPIKTRIFLDYFQSNIGRLS